MTAIPQEVFFPQELFIFKMEFFPLVHMVMVGVLQDLYTGMSFAPSRFKLASRENGNVHDEEQKDEPILYGSES